MLIIEKFEQWLNEINNYHWDKTETNKMVLIRELGQSYIDEFQKNLQEDFIAYRYRFVNNEVIKEEILLVIDSWHIRNVNRPGIKCSHACYIETFFKSVNVGDYNQVTTSTKKLNVLSYPTCIFSYENDKEVYQLFIQKEFERQNKAIQELEKAKLRIQALQEVL